MIIKKLLGIDPESPFSNPRLNDLIVNDHYQHMGDEKHSYFLDSLGDKRSVSAFLWEDVQIKVTAGPLSDDPLVNPKKAMGAVKAPFHATPELGIIQMNNVMAGGGYKYGDYNYHESDIDAMTYLSAMRRHYLLWKDGVDADEESGQSHLAHIMACCAILIESQAMDMMEDNRPKTGLVAQALLNSQETFAEYMKKVPSLEERNNGKSTDTN